VAVTALLDTNVVLYLLGGRLAEPLPAGAYAISVITEMELLSYPGMAAAEEASIREFLASVTLVELTGPVKTSAIALRRAHRLKLPDAIVAASAVNLDVELLTGDERLANTSALRVRLVRTR
jgi:predicted nucleic acid-binding protein